MPEVSMPTLKHVQNARIIEPRFENTQIQLTATAATALGSITGLAAWGFAFDELVFTKSAAVAAMTVDVCIGYQSMVLSVTEASTETLAITAKAGSVTLQGTPVVRNWADGALATAGALVQGSYQLVTH